MSQFQSGNRCVDRATLYAEIWETPGTQLSKKYGVSDVALGKACRRHDIPRPAPGYWAMLRNGYKVERTPLPALSDPRLSQVQFHPQHALAIASIDKGTAEVQKSRVPIAVREQLAPAHPLVEEARKQLRAGSVDESRIVRTNPATALNIAVASASITRTLKIMDALIRAWEEMGGSVKPGGKSFQGHHSTAFVIGPDEVLASLKERTEPVPDWKPPQNAPWRRYPPHRPNGRLVFAIEYYQGQGLRSTWSDGTRQRLEEILDRILDGVMIQVADTKRRRLDDECEARQSKLVEERRTVKQRRDAQEKLQRKSLVNDVVRWQRAEQIRSFLAAMQRSLESGKSRITDERVFAEWFDWATWYADHVDPLVRAKVRAEVAQPPINKPIAEMDLTVGTKLLLTELAVADANALHNVTKEQIEAVEERYNSRVWSEVCRVLEGLGYDVSGRSFWP